MRRSHQTVQWKQTDQELPINEYAITLPNFAYAAISCALSMMFVFSAVIMLNNVFPKYQFTSDGMFLMILEILAITIWNGLLENGKYRILRQIGNLILGIAIAFFLFTYYNQNSLNIQDGCLAIGQQYLDKWNYYYHTALYIDSWNKEYIDIAFGFVMIAIVAVMQLIASATKKPWIMMILPFLALLADLLIGYTPNWLPIAAMFAGMLIVFSNAWQRRKQLDQVLYLIALCVIVIFTTSCIFSGPAKAVAGAEDKMMEIQLKLEASIRNFTLFGGNFQDGSVDNSKPTYQDKEMIRVTSDEVPGQIYLRGFYGTDYMNQGWSSDSEGFQQACDNYDIASDKGALIISELPYKVTEKAEELQSSDYSGYVNTEKNYRIAYTGIKDTYAYLPYGVDASSIDESIEIRGDYEFRKARGLDEVQVTGNSGSAYKDSLFSSTFEVYSSTDEQYFTESNSNFSRWYNRYVLRTYLGVPEEQITAKEIAHTLSNDFEEEDEAWFVKEYGTTGDNYIREKKAQAVLKYLLMNENYSLDLDVLPRGEDPVEYFLASSHKGYCVHFASAAVFILREMGVPARYVTGYVGKENATLFNKDTNEYELSVKDSNGHAWVEVYMDSFGWIPVEVTPGNSQYWDSRIEMEKESAESNLADTNQNNTISNKQNQNNQQNNQEAENLQNQNEDTMQSENTETTATETEETGQGENLGIGQSESGSGSHTIDTTKLLRILASALGVLIVLTVGGYIILIRPKKQLLRTTRTIKNNLKHSHYKQAVNRINQSLYHDLRKDKKQIGWNKSLTDEEYIRELIAIYPQIDVEEWKRYINIARKAAYDNRELSEADAKFCYQIYKKHLQKEKKEAK